MVVKSEKDIPHLRDLIRKGKAIAFVVTMDWCGHCQTFKKDVWQKLKGLESRKIPMVEVNGDVLSKTPMANMKFDGYPSVGVIGSDGEMATVRGEDGTPTNSLPNTRDLETMQKLVSADPAAAAAANEAAATSADTVATDEASADTVATDEASADTVATDEAFGSETVPSPSPAPAAENNAGQSADRLLASIKRGTTNNLSASAMPPPSAEDDLIVSQSLSPAAMDALSAANETASGPMAGGGRRRKGSTRRKHGSLFSFLRGGSRRGGRSTV